MTILAAIGGKHEQDRVVEVGHDLATTYGDELVALHVMDEEQYEEIQDRSDTSRPVVVAGVDEASGIAYLDSGQPSTNYTLEDAVSDAKDVAQEVVSRTLSGGQQDNVRMDARVGDPATDDSHRIVVWNDDADSREIGVRLRRPETDETPLDVVPTFPAYGALRVDVFRRSDYVLRVDPPEGTDRRLGVRRDFVDCNDSATHVAVRPDGSIRARVISTALACDVGSQTSSQDPSTTPEGTPSSSADRAPSATPE
jgi:nucleotide-binding universal stress UspA family protein